MTKTTHRSELLAPAGSFDKLKIALLYGADAVYFGTPDMSMRAKSAFSLEEAVEGVKFAREQGKRAYLTLNLFAHNKDLLKLDDYLKAIKTVNPHGVIISDLGVFQYVKSKAPELELHVSTQANTCSWAGVKFWQEQGASLCVLSREVSFAELKEIREKCPDMKLEAFVHGAMCMAYSGRCMLSNYLIERGANQGSCANSCRWNYKVHMKMKDGTVNEIPITEQNKDLFDFLIEEEYRPGEFIPIEENSRGSYLLNAKDLCLMPKLDDYLSIGVDSLKLEGRNKSIYYVALATRAYRHAIDDWYAQNETCAQNLASTKDSAKNSTSATNSTENSSNSVNKPKWHYRKYMRELETIANRGYSLGFHDGRLTNYAHNYDDTHSLAEWKFAGIVEEIKNDSFYLLVKNKLEAGDVLEFVSPYSWETVLIRLYEFEIAESGRTPKVIQPGTGTIIRIPFSKFEYEDPNWLHKNFPKMTIVRTEKSMTEAEWARLKQDRTALKLQLGNSSESSYQRQTETVRDLLDQDNSERRLKTPRLGTDGCCGKGCNGCLMFAHDPLYAKARSLLAKKKPGVLLTKQESNEATS